MRAKHQVLVVDDDAGLARVVRLLLEEQGCAVTLAANVRDAKAALLARGFDLAVTDLQLPDGDGLEVLDAVKRASPGTQVVMITAFATVPTAVEAMKRGAFDYLTKPFDNDRFTTLVGNALRLRDLAQENVRLRSEAEQRYGLSAIVGSSSQMEKVREQIRLAAGSDAAVMIQGETGTGKELAARAIHLLGERAGEPFVAVNCGAIPENLVESELFGHSKGAFTGAVRDFDGRFVQADRGTIFLDEVTEMKPDSQVKLLRAIEAMEVQAVGATDARTIDVRVISATNRNPAECIRSGGFREDLYYRLNVFVLRLPPLREHRSDIPELVEHYLAGRGFSREMAGDDVLDLLAEHDFPGNVRELENVIESGLILSRGRTLRPEHIADRLMPSAPGPSARPEIPEHGISLEDVEKNYLVEVLKKAGGNKSHAARLLGISRATLLYRIKKHGL
ncbi:MAG: sigma-54-dependent Fis family transcriptional regulator [candidate division WOR-3 bacterium]|nr:MAG: sigma-54-dependent Fis family transcriptional regulator [candidate division WOR-3 bacterium]